MVEYGKPYQPKDSTPKAASDERPREKAIVVPDDLIVEFLAQHGVDAKPPGNPSRGKNALMGAVVGANPLVGGMLHVVNNQIQGGAQTEWLSWKQWALSHSDWPVFWESHKECLRLENEQSNPSLSPRPAREPLRYGMVTADQGHTQNLPIKNPARYIPAAVAGLLIMAIAQRYFGSPDARQAKEPATTAVQSFAPGVPGRSNNEVCNTSSVECQHWTALAIKCQDNMRRREEGYMGKFDRNYCTEMETYREQVTGVSVSTDPGAYSF